MARCRSRVNKDPVRGIRNRQYGLSRKAHLFHKDYNADILIVIQRPDGKYAGYQSKPGLLRQFRYISDDSLLSPSKFTKTQESDSDGISRASSIRSSSIESPISSSSSKTPSLSSELSSIKTPSLSSELSSLPSTPASPTSMNILPPAPTPPQIGYSETWTPSNIMSSIDPATFLSFAPHDVDASLSDNEIAELLWPDAGSGPSSSADMAIEWSHLIQPNPVSLPRREAILSLLDRYFGDNDAYNVEREL
ncbi:hypothetical protein M441DRAFT_132966 [Trichoderma asperellum CBS 433.97]|uniref:MADS-box domain-containing protein n=1 Tax=Trichoderma asperellum (strain ATCC 204424 / CBS 433.97 / NBRC 101777) TaxID=1042311 RepID=A0A2T3ZG85_TRIA4|nr:hypothetical protein M441DRAFT_132966 [Trichoderma asperellum CBS 433.97]PTB43828.1 hypothetical protein M441DRAFT_132966 [Trichoderma asperellum CBS 433.97]